MAREDLILKLFLAIVVALALTASAGAQECFPTTSQPEVDTGETPLGRHYVDNDLCQLSGQCLFSIWFYTESNGIDGLQRGDEVVDDTCGIIGSDSLTFF